MLYSFSPHVCLAAEEKKYSIAVYNNDTLAMSLMHISNDDVCKTVRDIKHC
jgi:hypothetical protein